MPLAEASSTEPWNCSQCTFENTYHSSSCEMCGWRPSGKMAPPASAIATSSDSVVLIDSQDMVSCPRCAMEALDDDDVCKHCGMRLKPSSTDCWTCMECSLENSLSRSTCGACNWQ